MSESLEEIMHFTQLYSSLTDMFIDPSLESMSFSVKVHFIVVCPVTSNASLPHPNHV